MILQNTENEQLYLVKKLYTEAFPKIERKPFTLIEEKAKEGKMEILSLQADQFVGLAILVFYKDLVLLDYFAISEEYRGYGYGSQALQLLKERYKDRRFFLEIELPDEHASNNAQRISRKAFYLRNGMQETGIHVEIFKTDMEILTSGCELNFDEYRNLYANAMGESYANRVKLLAVNH